MKFFSRYGRLIAFSLAGIFLVGSIILLVVNVRRATNGTTPEPTPTPTKATSTPTTQRTSSSSTTIKDSVSLNVPFIVQAPFANWDAVHEEACEEASLITVWYYRNNHPVADLNAGDADITALINWETAHNYGVSITLQQLSQIASDFYGLTTGRIILNPTVNDIKKELSAGRPVIIPAAGKVLPNPYFSDGGPNYHMLVIKGYNATQFITDDPGTKRGDGFLYTYDGLMNAIHDWDPGNILNGQKAVLVFD